MIQLPVEENLEERISKFVKDNVGIKGTSLGNSAEYLHKRVLSFVGELSLNPELGTHVERTALLGLGWGALTFSYDGIEHWFSTDRLQLGKAIYQIAQEKGAEVPYERILDFAYWKIMRTLHYKIDYQNISELEYGFSLIQLVKDLGHEVDLRKVWYTPEKEGFLADRPGSMWGQLGIFGTEEAIVTSDSRPHRTAMPLIDLIGKRLTPSYETMPPYRIGEVIRQCLIFSKQR